jgi:hypothetical protein
MLILAAVGISVVIVVSVISLGAFSEPILASKRHKALQLDKNIVAVLAAKSSNGIAMRSAFDENNEGYSKISLQNRRTPVRIRRLNAMMKIRRMIGEGHHSHKQIMEVLGLPQRLFYRYLRQAYDSLRGIL